MDEQEIINLEEVQKLLNDGIIKRIESLTKKFEAQLAEKDRIIAGLQSSLAQVSKDFKNLHEATK